MIFNPLKKPFACLLIILICNANKSQNLAAQHSASDENAKHTEIHFPGSSPDLSAKIIAGRQNNTDSAILYFGNWKLTRNSPGFYSEDFKCSNTQFNRCIFNFMGTYIRWFGSRNNNHGLADVYLDNVFQVTVDSYSPTLVTNALLFEKQDLEADKIHSIMIVVRKERNYHSIDSYQDIDCFETDRSFNYTLEVTKMMNEEYSEIQKNTKSYVLPSAWRPVPYPAKVPLKGVKILEGPIADAFIRNIKYLNHCYASPTYCDGTGWSEWLPGSVEARLLSGASGSLRWVDNRDLRMIVDTLLSRIAKRIRSDGYLNYYPENQSYELNEGMNSERKNYDRVFWTRGLLDAGEAGWPEAYRIIRKFYDWFNTSRYLPHILIGSNATNGFPGGGLVYHSPVGLAEDLIVNERYFDQDYWLKELAGRQPLSFSNYPGERPHCYDLLGLEAFLDEYTATGMPKYLDAVNGGWDVYNGNYEHTGGSTAICEGDYFPPGSYLLNSHTGETCGSVFWININSKLSQLFPEEEKYVTEIEKSIYNIILSAQDTNGYIRYHNNLHGRKDKPGCAGTCCEVSSVGLISKLPQYIYSIAEDGLYVNLFTPSSITWNVLGRNFSLTTSTDFPYNGKISMIISNDTRSLMNLRIRIPSWVDGNVEISVNGKVVGAGNPGTFISINRKWSDNDKIHFTLPMKFNAVKYSGIDQVDGNLDRYAITYGPLLMALIQKTGDFSSVPWLKVPVTDLPALLELVPGSRLMFNLKGYPEYCYLPYWMVKDMFTCYPIIGH